MEQDLHEIIEIWPQLLEEEKNILLSQASRVKYKKNKNIMAADDVCVGVLFIISGRLRVYMLSPDGKEITLYYLEKGEVCILSASCVLDNIDFEIFVDADLETETINIPSNVFKDIAERNIYFKCYAYQLTTDRFSNVMWALQQILFLSVDSRLARYLLDEMNMQNSSEIKVTHEKIAKDIGSVREVVSRMLQQFKKSDIVSLHRGGIKIIKEKELEKIAN